MGSILMCLWISGEELTIAYVNPSSDRRHEILKQHDIICTCRLCQWEAELREGEGVSQEESLLKRIRNCANLLEKAGLFKKLSSVSKATSTKASFSQLDASLVNLGSDLYAEKEYKLALEVMEIQRIFCASNYLLDDTINLDLSLFTIYLDAGDKEGAKGWLKWLKKDMLHAYGQVAAGFLKDYQVVKNLGECGINFEELLNNPEAVNGIRVSLTGGGL